MRRHARPDMPLAPIKGHVAIKVHYNAKVTLSCPVTRGAIPLILRRSFSAGGGVGGGRRGAISRPLSVAGRRYRKSWEPVKFIRTVLWFPSERRLDRVTQHAAKARRVYREPRREARRIFFDARYDTSSPIPMLSFVTRCTRCRTA